MDTIKEDKVLDQSIALLRVALTTLKSVHPLQVSTAQFTELQVSIREIMEEASRVERDAFAAEKQALVQTVASQKQQIVKYRLDLDDHNERCKLLKVESASQKAECERLVGDDNRTLKQHIRVSSEQFALLKKQLDEEKQHVQEHTQALSMQVTALEKQLAEERMLLNASGEKLAHLDNQLAEEKEKLLCVVCLEKPRDTLIMPCLHFHYCFCCLMQHKQANGSTCPTCRGTIQGLCMSSFLT